ncbi:MAG: hypothetical protein VW453_11040, partial [Rhodospirillaceae bacterium]
ATCIFTACPAQTPATNVALMSAEPMALSEDELAQTAIDWRNLIWVGLALAVMVVAIIVNDLWFLNFVHVFTGLLWTGIDLLLGFVIGPILRRLEFPVRRAITMRLMPRLLFILPTVAIIAPTAGWFMAVEMGYLDLAFPEVWWLIAALAITAVLSVQGLLVLLPTNVMVYLEMRKPAPDGERIGRLMRRYVRVVAFQGSMQIVIIVIMARFATGL